MRHHCAGNPGGREGPGSRGSKRGRAEWSWSGAGGLGKADGMERGLMAWSWEGLQQEGCVR